MQQRSCVPRLRPNRAKKKEKKEKRRERERNIFIKIIQREIPLDISFPMHLPLLLHLVTSQLTLGNCQALAEPPRSTHKNGQLQNHSLNMYQCGAPSQSYPGHLLASSDSPGQCILWVPHEMEGAESERLNLAPDGEGSRRQPAAWVSFLPPSIPHYEDGLPTWVSFTSPVSWG